MINSWRWALPLLLVSTMATAQTVTDDSGNQVEIHPPAQHIADAWFAHHSLLMTLGAGDRIVATVNHPADRPWMFKVQPSLHQALQAHGKTFASEALQIQWAAKQLHPALFPQLDMVKATQDFYQKFYDYSLSANDAQRILKALPPE